jgi:hypothetical protein
MRMNKNELIRWLKSEREGAVFAHRTAFEAKRASVEEQLYAACGANDLIKNLNEIAAKELDLIRDFNKSNSGKMEMATYYGHNDASQYLKIFDPAFRRLKDSYQQEREAIMKNYDNVIRQVRILPLKAAMEWLTELGLEIPEKSADTTKNEIVVQIDTTYLWLRGKQEATS